MISQLSTVGQSVTRRISLPKHHLKTHIKEFGETIGPTPLILDIGSGRLRPYQALFTSQRHIGIDYFEEADANADAGYLPFASQVANVVLVTEVLEHLPDPCKALQEMNRVLACDGYLVLTVPLVWGVHDYVDYQRWTERGLSKLLNENGFEVLELKRRGGIFSTLGSMITNIPRQCFGEMKEQRHWWTTGAYMVSWAALAPIPWLASLFDRFDRRQDFTFGYSVLCRKT